MRCYIRFHIELRKTKPPDSHEPKRPYKAILGEAIKRVDQFCESDCNPPQDFILVLDQHQRPALNKMKYFTWPVLSGIAVTALMLGCSANTPAPLLTMEELVAKQRQPHPLFAWPWIGYDDEYDVQFSTERQVALNHVSPSGDMTLLNSRGMMVVTVSNERYPKGTVEALLSLGTDKVPLHKEGIRKNETTTLLFDDRTGEFVGGGGRMVKAKGSPNTAGLRVDGVVSPNTNEDGLPESATGSFRLDLHDGSYYVGAFVFDTSVAL